MYKYTLICEDSYGDIENINIESSYDYETLKNHNPKGSIFKIEIGDCSETVKLLEIVNKNQ